MLIKACEEGSLYQQTVERQISMAAVILKCLMMLQITSDA